MLTFIVSISFAQYTPMTAAGYQFKRILCDSTLHIPSFCGVPTLRNSSAKNGAIALDTCNNLFYKWTNATGWTVITGVGNIVGVNGLNGSDSIKLGGPLIENTIIYGNQNFNLYDLKTIDLAARGKGEVYIDSVLVGIGGNFLDLQTDSTNIPSSDTSYYKPLAIGSSQVVRRMSSWPKTDTSSLSNRINLKLNISDTATMLSKYLRKTDTISLSNRINLKLNISDTATMLSKYLRKTDTASLSNRINLKLNISDTTNKWVNAVTKVNDSTIRVWKGTTSTTIELPRGSGGGGGTGTVFNVSTGYALSGGPINTTGTIIVDSVVLSTKYLRRADTSNLVATKSNLAAKLNISDTATMLSKYLRKVDTASLSNRINLKLNIADTTNKWVNAVTKKNDSTITVFKGTSATDITLPRGASGGTGTVTNVATGYGLSGGPITLTGTIIVDSATLSTKYLRINDTTAMLSKYLRKIDTASLSNRINLKLNISDTATMLSKYLRKTDTVSLSNRINLKLNISDTASMLSSYLRKIDTTNKFVNAVTKVNDSTIRVFKGSTSTEIILPRGTGGGGGTGTVTNVATGYGLSGGPITSTGTIIIDSATLSTKYLRISDTTAMLSPYLMNSDTISLSNRINLKVNISDTATMLSPYLRKVDTVSLSNRINLKVNISDTATMLSKYLRKTDTASLSNRINLKVNISDTATMLSNYLRKIDTANKFVNNVTKINDTSFRVWKGTTSSVVAFAKDIVYTQSPIMSKVSNDSNIIYFNADTADVWRGGGGGSGTVTNVSTGYGLSGGPITSTGTIIIDSATLSTKYLRINDTTAMLSKYLRKIDTASLSNRINLKVNISDTATMLSTYLRKTDTASLSNRINLKVNISDTASMLLPYLFGSGTANYIPKFVNGRKMSISSIADSSSKIYFTTQNLTFDIILGYPRMISSQSVEISSQATSGDRLILGNIGGNTTATTNEVVNEFGDVSATSGLKINTLIRGRLLHTSGTQEVDLLKIAPEFQQTGTPTTTTRGIYYAPTFTTTYNGKHIALQTTSGDIIFNNLKTSSSTSDSIAIFINDTLKKAPYPTGTGGGIPYTGATADVDLGAHLLSAQGLRVTGTNGAGDIHLRHQATDATATGQSTSLFADANGDLKYKNAGNFYTTLKTSTNTADRTYTYPNATTTLIGAADTSVFQRKSISSYTMLANNTNASGNATAQTFRDTAGTYAGTITWTGTAPTTQTINKYQWQQTGKMVRLQLFGYYTNAAVAATSVSLTIPSDCPNPDISMFTSGSLAILYQGIGGLGLSNTALTTTTNAYMRRNAANTDNELLISAAGANYRRYQIDITYRAQ